MGQSNYSAAKAGLIGFTKALAQENAFKGITVNAIAPGYIATEMVRAVPEEVLNTKILPQIPVGRLGEAEEAVTGWPQVIQHVEFADIGERLGEDTLPVVVQLASDEPHGFARDWKPVYGISPDKHRAYAMQWFTLALVLVVIYTGVNTKRVENDGQE